MMSRWLLALLLTVAGAPCVMARDAATTRDVDTAIAACLRRLDPGLDIGYPRIVLRCPDLVPTLTTGAWAAALPADWNKAGNELSAGGLAELRTLLTREPMTPAVRAPRVARVAAALAGLKQDDHAPRGWWGRFKQWLRQLFTPPPHARDDGWLRRILGNLTLSEALRNAIVGSALALVAALAALIVGNELRVAGLLRPRRASRRGAPDRAAAGAGHTLREVEQASPAQQPRLLLELIVARLRAQERLPPAGALTVRELTRAARLASEPERAQLEALAATCERIRFADREIPPQVLAGALASGRELLAALGPPPAAAAA